MVSKKTYRNKVMERDYNMEVYLDNAATTKLTDSVKEYLISILDDFGNPSSLYSISKKPKQIISEARQADGKFINAD